MTTTTSLAEAHARLGSWPRAALADLPTSLRALPRLSAKLGGVPLYAKMDAETGFALGGNKVRKLEFELAPDRIDGITHLVTAGGPQSNHCRVTAAFAAKADRSCVLVTQGPAPETPTGNALLHRLFGAEVVVVPERDDRIPAMELVARKIDAEGGRALVVPIGASTGLGCLGYAVAAFELADQIDVLSDGCSTTDVFVSTSSGGTLAGLILGLALMEREDIRLRGVSADAPADELLRSSLTIAREGADLLGVELTLGHVSVEVSDDQVGQGYGIPTPRSLAATDAFARLEGIVLDPTYTSKAGAALLTALEMGNYPPERRAVFLHTGGAPGLLA